MEACLGGAKRGKYTSPFKDKGSGLDLELVMSRLSRVGSGGAWLGRGIEKKESKKH